MNKITDSEAERWRTRACTAGYSYLEVLIAKTLQSRLSPLVVGMLNSRGGQVVVELRASDTSLKAENLSSSIASAIRKITPRVRVHSGVLWGPDRQSIFVVIEIPMGERPPYAYKDVIYTRDALGNTDPAKPEAIVALIADSQEPSERWERQPVLKARLEDLELNDDNTIDLFARALRTYGTRNDPKSFRSSHWRALENLRLGKDPLLFRSAVIVLGKRPSTFVQSYSIRAIAYDTEESDAGGIRDKAEFDSGLIQAVDRCVDFCRRHSVDSSIFPDERSSSARRIEYEDVPRIALRESIVNAVVHRDYSAGGDVLIRLTPSKIEISNPGAFIGGVDATLGDRHSRQRNPDIAYAMRIAGYMEAVGSGIPRIRRSVAEHGLPDPQWSESEGRIRVILHRKGATHSDEWQLPEYLHPVMTTLSPGDRISVKVAGLASHESDLVRVRNDLFAEAVSAGTLRIVSDDVLERTDEPFDLP